MDLNTVYYLSLLRDELVYEVTIRAEIPEDTVPKLKKQLKGLCLGFGPEEIVDEELNPKVELPIIKEKLKDLITKIDSAQKSRERYSLSRIRGLYCHLYHRLQRVVCEDDIHAQTREKLFIDLKQTGELVSNLFEIVDDPGNSKGDSQTEPHIEEVVHCSANKNILKWNLSFDGQSSPHSFLESVAERATAFKVCDSDLFRSAFALFKGQALLWYRGVKDQVSSWKGLSGLLLEEFAPVDFDYRLLGEIRARTQGQDELTHIYFAVMNCMFSRLKKPLSDKEKLEILLHNIRPSFTEHLALVDINSIGELKEKCRKIESARQRKDLFTEPPSTSILSTEYLYKKDSKQKQQVTAVQPTSTHTYTQNSPPTHQKFTKQFCHKCRVDTTPKLNNKKLRCFKCGKDGYTILTCPNKCSNKSKN